MAREKLEVILYKTLSGKEPFVKWFDELDEADQAIIAADIQTVQYGYPVGMPTTRSLKGYKPLEEIRSHLTGKKIARIVFYVEANYLVLLHSFIKKSQKTPKKELDTALKRYKDIVTR